MNREAAEELADFLLGLDVGSRDFLGKAITSGRPIMRYGIADELQAYTYQEPPMNDNERTKIVRNRIKRLRRLARATGGDNGACMNGVANDLESTLPPEGIEFFPTLAPTKADSPPLRRNRAAPIDEALDAKLADLGGAADELAEECTQGHGETPLEVHERVQPTKTPESRRLDEQRLAMQRMTVLVAQVMSEYNVSNAELASRIEATEGQICSMLRVGRMAMTIEEAADIFAALDRSLHFSVSPLGEEADKPIETGRFVQLAELPTEAGKVGLYVTIDYPDRKKG